MLDLEFQPEIEAELRAEAAARGVSVEFLLEEILLDHLAEESIREGLEDMAAGRTRPAREVFDELREERGSPR